MRKIRLLVAIAATVFHAGCEDTPLTSDEASESSLAVLSIARNVVAAVPAVCSAPTVADLVANEVDVVGSVQVLNDESNIYVVYETRGEVAISKSALFVGSSADDIPTSGGGNPQVGRFPHASRHPAGTTRVIWEIPLGDLPREVAVAAFAEVGPEGDGAWADGTMISSQGSWATYFTHTVANCGAETVDEDGGVVTSRDGRVSFSVPEGALSSPVDITITEATYEDVRDRVDAVTASGAASTGTLEVLATARATVESLPLLGGIRPIANTFWDLAPDGLEFQKAAYITLSYRDEDIPDGTDESELGVFVINGVIPYERIGVVDPEANTVTAPVEHFSYAFVGTLELAVTDLAVTELFQSTDFVQPGEPVAYSGTIQNLGPVAVPDARVRYRLFGDDAATAGFAPESCEVFDDPVGGGLEISCPIGRLEPGTGARLPGVEIIPGTEGRHDFWLVATSAVGDPDPANDRLETVLRVGTSALRADLTLSAFDESEDPVTLGTSVFYRATVQNLGPDEVPDARVVYQLFGDEEARIGFIPESCTQVEAPIFAEIEISCDAGAVAPGTSSTAGAIELVMGSLGEHSLWISAFSAAEDPDTENNRQETTITVLESTLVADVAVVDVRESLDPIQVGQEVTYQGTVENLGPDATEDTRLTYTLFGDPLARTGFLAPGCVEADPPLFGDLQVTCELGGLAVGERRQGVGIELIPSATGEYEVWVSAGSSANDPESANNRQETTVTVVDQWADLGVVDIVDTPDPALPGEAIAYTVTYQNDASALPVEGAQLRLIHGGDATFVSASVSGCTTDATTITCPAPVLSQRVLQETTFTVLPTPGLSVLGVAARVLLPPLTVDPDMSDNERTEGTEIRAVSGADLVMTMGWGTDDTGERILVGGDVENLGPEVAEDVLIRLTLVSQDRVYQVFPCDETTLDPGGGIPDERTFECPVGAVPVGGRASFLLELDVTSGSSGIVTGEVTSSTPDPVPENNLAGVQYPGPATPQAQPVVYPGAEPRPAGPLLPEGPGWSGTWTGTAAGSGTPNGR